MKDQEARFDIGVQRIMTKNMQAQIDLLSGELLKLRTAYDALFDVVAVDLGYKPATVPLFMFGPSIMADSPRRFAKTSPQAELVRVPARFKKG